MNPVEPLHMHTQQTITRRRLLVAMGLGGLNACAATPLLKGNDMQNYATEIMKWEFTSCHYGLDIDPKAYARVETLWRDNWFKDADGNIVAKFYSGFSAAWGAGTTGMGGPSNEGSRLPKTLRMTYYDYLEDKFYKLDAELPQQQIYELFKQRAIDKDVNYGQIRGRFDNLRIGVAPHGNVMLWAAGIDQVELKTYYAHELTGLTRESYNASLPGGTFKLMEDRWRALAAGRIQPQTIERIKAGWVPSASWYMRDIRVKYPWRHRLTGNARRIVELESYQGNAEAQTIGAWEMNIYATSAVMRGIPKTAKFWFDDLTGKRHHLWVSFSLRDRALSEKDLSEVRAAFEQVFPKRQLEDNAYLPGEKDMATVEVHVGDDFKTFTASLVKGDLRLPLPIGKHQHFFLEPYTHWPSIKTEEISPEVRRLFQHGPGA